ncbi:response regulator [Streptomyces sp. DH20]|uniref:response regulator transcription factor n=1 Tax=Streptomyces sp. DH20 TaxID=2857009 RepID=UPI001E50EB00|nr:response regulator transcription factor [Streptomyces sp. DH20]
MTVPAPIRVVLADDERMVRSALRAILSAEPDLEVAGEAATGAEAVAVVRELRPDVVLMDVRMPGTDGIRATETILAGPGEPPRIVVVTTFENDAYVYDALRAGAAGFLLPEAVRALAAEHARARPAPPAWVGRLTGREREVLRHMAGGLTNAEIAGRLGVGAATVKTHVASVLAKTGARDRTQAVVAAYEAGFLGGR